jgi:tetratricopeptide (TPR) repeat protein
MRHVLFVGLFLIIMLYQTRVALGAKRSTSRMHAGDYDGALRWLRWTSLGNPGVRILHQEGLTLSIAGRLADAERRYRRALAMLQGGGAYPRERLHACLGFVLIDRGRYDEAEQCFHRAIEAGDVTGSSETGLAELRLAQGVESDKALAYTEEAIVKAKRRGRLHWGTLADKAWALASLGRADEAREAIAQAMTMPEESVPGRAERHWRVGMTLLAMQQTEEARKHFHSGQTADPRGKYGRRCKELLRTAEPAVA